MVFIGLALSKGSAFDTKVLRSVCFVSSVPPAFSCYRPTNLARRALMHGFIEAIEYVLPKNTLTTEELSKTFPGLGD
jgi:hypothetical protein